MEVSVTNPVFNMHSKSLLNNRVIGIFWCNIKSVQTDWFVHKSDSVLHCMFCNRVDMLTIYCQEMILHHQSFFLVTQFRTYLIIRKLYAVMLQIVNSLVVFLIQFSKLTEVWLSSSAGSAGSVHQSQLSSEGPREDCTVSSETG